MTSSSDYEPHLLGRPEPGNKHDASAVAVWVSGQHVGYVPKVIPHMWHDTFDVW